MWSCLFCFYALHFIPLDSNGSLSVAPLILWISQKWNKMRFWIECGCMFHFEAKRNAPLSTGFIGWHKFFFLFLKFNWSIIFFSCVIPPISCKQKKTIQMNQNNTCDQRIRFLHSCWFIVCKLYLSSDSFVLCSWHKHRSAYSIVMIHLLHSWKKEKSVFIVHCMNSYSFK